MKHQQQLNRIYNNTIEFELISNDSNPSGDFVQFRNLDECRIAVYRLVSSTLDQYPAHFDNKVVRTLQIQFSISKFIGHLSCLPCQSHPPKIRCSIQQSTNSSLIIVTHQWPIQNSKLEFSHLESLTRIGAIFCAIHLQKKLKTVQTSTTTPLKHSTSSSSPKQKH